MSVGMWVCMCVFRDFDFAAFDVDCEATEMACPKTLGKTVCLAGRPTI